MKNVLVSGTCNGSAKIASAKHIIEANVNGVLVPPVGVAVPIGLRLLTVPWRVLMLQPVERVRFQS